MLERVRVLTAPDGTTSSEDDAIALTNLTAADLEAEGRAAGLRPEDPHAIDETDAHMGSTVVMLGVAEASCGSARCIRTS